MNSNVLAVSKLLREAAASGSPDALLRAGGAAFQAGVSSEMADAVDPIARAYPDQAELWQLLGLMRHQLEELGPAADAFERAARLRPDDPGTAHNLACVRFEAGLPAADAFEQALRLARGDPAILLRHAAALVAEGRRDTATAAIERELRRNPGWIKGREALARLRWEGGEQDGIARSFVGALEAAPRDAALWRAYVEMLLDAGLYDQALAAINRARTAAGPQPTFDAAEAIARTERGELAQADALFGQLTQVMNTALIVSRLRHLFRSGRVEEAAALAERTAPRDPENRIWPYLTVGWRLLGDPRWEELEGDPRFIGVYDLAGKLSSIDALADRLRSLHHSTYHPLNQSLRGGTQTDGHLFPRIEPDIAALRAVILEAVQGYVAQLPPPRSGHPLLIARRAPIRFAGSWSVRLTDGGRHIEHFHPAGWISSAFYVSLPRADERGASEAGWLSLGEVTDLGLDLSPIRLVEPKPGRLVLFPSYMWHGTRPFAAGERLTVAFDVKRPD